MPEAVKGNFGPLNTLSLSVLRRVATVSSPRCSCCPCRIEKVGLWVTNGRRRSGANSTQLFGATHRPDLFFLFPPVSGSLLVERSTCVYKQLSAFVAVKMNQPQDEVASCAGVRNQ